MKYIVFSFLLFARATSAQVAAPVLSSWLLNTTGQTGYGGIASNIQMVQYSDSNVYVTCTCIPGYDIGPWPGNPNTPKDQNFLFRITRNPTPNTGALTPTPLGHIGVWTNGVSIFNAKDGHSYNNDGVWNQNAVVVEAASFDKCLGHPNQNGEYHHHLNPVCLYNDKDSTHHSPIIGYAFDGYPIYGTYGYSNPDGTGGIRQMRSSYRLRTITERTTLPDGSPANQSGPMVSAQYPLGYYIEDFEYVPGLGDLDSNNGRFCVTPEYPNGTYAYFVTNDSTGTAQYPYILGPYYHGVVTNGDTGPGSGHVIVAEPVLTYAPNSSVSDSRDSITLTLYPNPTSQWLIVDYASPRDFVQTIRVFDLRGVSFYHAPALGPTTPISIANLASGNYFVQIRTSSGTTYTRTFIKS